MLYLDLETYNEQDIRAGTYRYAETAEVLLFAFAYGDGPVHVWDRTAGEPMPDVLHDLLQARSVRLCAHNALFDRTVLRLSMGIDTPLERWRCTMAKAYSHAFPGSLEACGAALGLPGDRAKLADGRKLVQRFCKPAPASHKARRYDSSTHPEEWERFKQYAARDIEAMREVDRRLPSWNWKDSDIALWHLDQRINDRGFQVDLELVKAGAEAAETDRARMAQEIVRLTGGVVGKPTQREAFRNYLNTRFGLGLGNTRAETLRELLAGKRDLDPDCRRLLQIGLMSGKTSTSKYAALLQAVSSDGRFRGGLQFRGAARTRRWAGRTFQPHNLPSRALPPRRSIDVYIRALKAGCHDVLFRDRMRYGSAALRGVLVAPEGKKLAVADLSNIEGRVLAWLAGETWKIRAFFDYDAGKGPDLYNVTATGILGGDPRKVPKETRNIFGKVPDLACGYEGGFGAFQTFSKAYGVNMADYLDTIAQNVDPALITAARENWKHWGGERNPEADPDEWLASEIVKLAWRARHPKTVRLWKACRRAAAEAISNPGRWYAAGPKLRFAVRRHAGKSYLLAALPSGNCLCYAEPRYHENHENKAITYMGVDSTATGGMFGKWQRLATYGGKLVENICQSLAMDIMAANMPEIDKRYPVVLTVHDEIVAEADADDSGAGDRLAKLMSRPPEWLPDFPLAAEGFECRRYRKD